MNKVTISVQELSSQMGISLAKAYELTRRPGFPILRVGTRILIPVDSLREWLQSPRGAGSQPQRPVLTYESFPERRKGEVCPCRNREPSHAPMRRRERKKKG